MLALHTTTAATRCQISTIKQSLPSNSFLALGGRQQLSSFRRIAVHGFNRVLVKVVRWGDAHAFTLSSVSLVGLPS